MGEFDWAKEQLKVLKAATSQLISNDALSLGLLISDNTNMDTDTTFQALLTFSRADLLDFQNQDSLALMTLDSLLENFPKHSLTDEVYYKKAQIVEKSGKFQLAAGYYQMVVDSFPDDILGDDALFQLADLYDNKLNDKVKAQTLYEQLLTKYPGSLFVVDARKRFRALRGDKL
jgi:outer membrane protein assembly factor BamD (BamD/ComL family)